MHEMLYFAPKLTILMRMIFVKIFYRIVSPSPDERAPKINILLGRFLEICVAKLFSSASAANMISCDEDPFIDFAFSFNRNYYSTYTKNT
jgi:hypothetical protein